MRKNIILIGGAPTVGKSSLAKKLAEESHLPWISTDTIRDLMREVVKKDNYPDLFYFTEQDLNEYLKNKTAQQIVEDQNRESRAVWKGVEAIIRTDYNWDLFIVEGVAVLPDLIKKEYLGNKIKPIFVLTDNKEKIKKVIYERGLWTAAEKYSDDLKNKEIEWVVAFNDWLETELKKYDYPAIRCSDKEFDIGEVKKYL